MQYGKLPVGQIPVAIAKVEAPGAGQIGTLFAGKMELEIGAAPKAGAGRNHVKSGGVHDHTMSGYQNK